MNDKIFMHFPIEIEKGEDGQYKRVIIKGKASTPHQDKQGEWIDPMGCDIDDFKRISDDHIKGNMGTIGEIKKAHKDHEAVWIDEAELYPELKQVQHIVKLADAIKKRPDSKMQLSFSIEGSATERDTINPKRILKAKLTGAAVTLQPINGNATAELFAKSLNYDDTDFDALEKSDNIEQKRYLYEWTDSEGVKCGLTKSFEIEKSGGEGSRGGKVIGYTKSGKPIYDKFEHESHNEFSKDDHKDAQKLHKDRVQYHSLRLDAMRTSYNSKEGKEHQEYLKAHHEESKKHGKASIKEREYKDKEYSTDRNPKANTDFHHPSYKTKSQSSDLEKGTYVDNTENRKLGRVGQHYGEQKKEESKKLSIKDLESKRPNEMSFEDFLRLKGSQGSYNGSEHEKDRFKKIWDMENTPISDEYWDRKINESKAGFEQAKIKNHKGEMRYFSDQLKAFIRDKKADNNKFKKTQKSTTAELEEDDSDDVLKKEELKKKTVSLIAKAIEEKRISKEKGKKMLKHFLNQ